MFFFEKKNQKTFAPWRSLAIHVFAATNRAGSPQLALSSPTPARSKRFFAAFFSKKAVLL
jgi:hypothetical protein